VILGWCCFELELCIVLLTPVSRVRWGWGMSLDRKKQVEETVVVLDLVQGCVMIIAFF
jgi:hypothetical protein